MTKNKSKRLIVKLFDSKKKSADRKQKKKNGNNRSRTSSTLSGPPNLERVSDDDYSSSSSSTAFDSDTSFDEEFGPDTMRSSRSGIISRIHRSLYGSDDDDESESDETLSPTSTEGRRNSLTSSGEGSKKKLVHDETDLVPYENALEEEKMELQTFMYENSSCPDKIVDKMCCFDNIMENFLCHTDRLLCTCQITDTINYCLPVIPDMNDDDILLDYGCIGGRNEVEKEKPAITPCDASSSASTAAESDDSSTEDDDGKDKDSNTANETPSKVKSMFKNMVRAVGRSATKGKDVNDNDCSVAVTAAATTTTTVVKDDETEPKERTTPPPSSPTPSDNSNSIMIRSLDRSVEGEKCESATEEGSVAVEPEKKNKALGDFVNYFLTIGEHTEEIEDDEQSDDEKSDDEESDAITVNSKDDSTVSKEDCAPTPSRTQKDNNVVHVKHSLDCSVDRFVKELKSDEYESSATKKKASTTCNDDSRPSEKKNKQLEEDEFDFVKKSYKTFSEEPSPTVSKSNGINNNNNKNRQSSVKSILKKSSHIDDETPVPVPKPTTANENANANAKNVNDNNSSGRVGSFRQTMSMKRFNKKRINLNVPKNSIGKKASSPDSNTSAKNNTTVEPSSTNNIDGNRNDASHVGGVHRVNSNSIKKNLRRIRCRRTDGESESISNTDNTNKAETKVNNTRQLDNNNKNGVVAKNAAETPPVRDNRNKVDTQNGCDDRVSSKTLPSVSIVVVENNKVGDLASSQLNKKTASSATKSTSKESSAVLNNSRKKEEELLVDRTRDRSRSRSRRRRRNLVNKAPPVSSIEFNNDASSMVDTTSQQVRKQEKDATKTTSERSMRSDNGNNMNHDGRDRVYTASSVSNTNNGSIDKAVDPYRQVNNNSKESATTNNDTTERFASNHVDGTDQRSPVKSEPSTSNGSNYNASRVGVRRRVRNKERIIQNAVPSTSMNKKHSSTNNSDYVVNNDFFTSQLSAAPSYPYPTPDDGRRSQCSNASLFDDKEDAPFDEGRPLYCSTVPEVPPAEEAAENEWPFEFFSIDPNLECNEI